MKTPIQKEMRKIRVKLKLHDIPEEEKKVLREELERWRIIQKSAENNEKHFRDTSENQ
jgi:hypothetical protein